MPGNLEAPLRFTLEDVYTRQLLHLFLCSIRPGLLLNGQNSRSMKTACDAALLMLHPYFSPVLKSGVHLLWN